MKKLRFLLIFGRLVYFVLGFAACFFIFPLKKNSFEKKEESFMAGLNYMNGCYWAASRLPEAQKNHDKWLKRCLSASNSLTETHSDISSQMDNLETEAEKSAQKK